MIAYGIMFHCSLCPARAEVWAPTDTGTTPSAWSTLPQGWSLTIVRTYPTRMRTCPACTEKARAYQAAHHEWRLKRWAAIQRYYMPPRWSNADELARAWERGNPPPERPARVTDPLFRLT